ncbi:MAG: hypothetical protein IT428_16060 [Planctomycetaceae bacterium]|nr:hypothetical protein [Planctomycetaceae bacterium]
MKTTSFRRLAVVLACGAVVVGGALIYREQLGRPAARPSKNSILVIQPYDYSGTWVFDDPGVGLVREPFVANIPEMIDVLVKDIPDAKSGFRLLFSAVEFPDYQKRLTWVRKSGEGNYYQLDDPPMEGWICPALFRYYEEAPPALYVKAEPLKRTSTN